MMSEKRFIVESVEIIEDCNEDKSRIAKVITDKEEIYSYDDLYDIVDLLNSLASENEQLRTELFIEQTDCKNVKESRNRYREALNKIPPKIRDVWIK